jgi:hypothetical protein
MTASAVNVPLVALFGLAYGLGHPACAPYRPALVDKTLASFHADVNRTAKDLNAGLQKLVVVRDTLTASAQGKPAPKATVETKQVRVEGPSLQHARAAVGIVEPKATAVEVAAHGKPPGFTELKAR